MQTKTNQAIARSADLGQLPHCLRVASRRLFRGSEAARFEFFQSLGRVLGARLATVRGSRRIEDRIRQVKVLCKNLELGEVKIRLWEPMLFVVYRGPDSTSLGSEPSEAFAAFRMGVLDAFLSEGVDSFPFVAHAIAPFGRKSRH